MSGRIWRLRSNRSASYSRGIGDRTYTSQPFTASVQLTKLVGKAFYITPPDPPAPTTGNKFSAANPTWVLGPGETLLDGRSTLATLVQATDYTSSRDIAVVLRTIETAVTGPVHVQLESGKYFMNKLINYGSPDWRGYTSAGTRRVLGMVGAGYGVDGSGNPKLLTEVVFSSTMISSTTDLAPDGRTAVQYALDPPLTAPVALTGFYFSNTSPSGAPLFFSGIHFMGQLQTPFSVYSTNAQTKFKRLQTTPSPLPYDGFSIWRAQAGSRFQFCKFSGVGFTLNSAPPYEKCAVGTNYCNIVSYKVEIDGRTDAEYDAARRRAGGGWMLNKSINEDVQHMHLHHTRRSGFAFNSNTHSTTEVVKVTNNEFLEISNFGAEDTWASDVQASFNPVAGFNDYNIEAHMGQYYITDAHSNSAHGHASIAMPFGDGAYKLPVDRTYLFVKNFRTDDTIYSSMFRLGTLKQPNSTGISDVWTKLNTDFNFYTNLWFDIRRADGFRLAPVKATVYNANPSLYGPNTHYVMTTF